ncbi:MAG: hypothetical protein JW820_08570, partial [Spirochaetales bacterium]|nr:hypothetical protein [Spirochaetales bacterium]
AGAIGAWEMSRRLLLDGSYGSKPMKLHLVQNEPYAPIAEAWGRGSRELARMEEREAKARIGRLHSSSLSNRKPPYAVSGGVYDALRDSGGQTYAVTSEEALLAGWLFESLEGCDLDPAADVAVAGLVRAARQRSIGSGDLVLLNLTGGGRKRLALDLPIRSVQPDYVFSSKDLSPMELERQLHSAPAVTPA